MKVLAYVLGFMLVVFPCGLNADARAGKSFYRVCISCHGKKGEQNAHGQSQIIGKWDKKAIVDALWGYKKRKYGGKYKNTMYAFVSMLNKKKMEDIADYLVSVNK